jgi:hypothetical protein
VRERERVGRLWRKQGNGHHLYLSRTKDEPNFNDKQYKEREQRLRRGVRKKERAPGIGTS